MKIAVCDDDNLFVQQTGQAVQEWAQERELSASVFSFDNGDSLLNAYAAEKFDILLLDIMMPLFTGMELAHAIREIDAAAKIIFLTSSPEFAVESYEVKASGYLLKPLQKEKLHSVLDDCVAPPRRASRNTSSSEPATGITKSISTTSNAWRPRIKRSSSI